MKGDLYNARLTSAASYGPMHCQGTLVPKPEELCGALGTAEYIPVCKQTERKRNTLRNCMRIRRGSVLFFSHVPIDAIRLQQYNRCLGCWITITPSPARVMSFTGCGNEIVPELENHDLGPLSTQASLHRRVFILIRSLAAYVQNYPTTRA
ncbi:hypothetical protein EVAR_40152_1 [Eumeta japonica]|uniref:Uncharacterized protein n=1 Tax=Eumeta variegata TaxID=151549 RepID=A0A4C1YHN2_EUMVA|nr:hypothetical protein EVAR_40152_1 [Eumeta japonica]